MRHNVYVQLTATKEIRRWLSDYRTMNSPNHLNDLRVEFEQGRQPC